MSREARFLLAVQMDVQPEQLAEFQRVYDDEHVPSLMRVPGIVGIRRFQREPVVRIGLGGSIQNLSFPDEPVFTALYELEAPEVLTGDAWRAAVDLGSWSTSVRPFTRNRRHTLHRLIGK